MRAISMAMKAATNDRASISSTPGRLIRLTSTPASSGPATWAMAPPVCTRPLTRLSWPCGTSSGMLDA